MGERCLIDSNVIIDFCNGKVSENGRRFLERLAPEISIVTNIELFATKNISVAAQELLARFVSIALVHPVTVDLIEATIEIRKEYRLKLPDAIIAATALVFDLVLLSRNTSDFSKVNGLQVVNLYDI
jgi:predicted nucleic acid-binding protein